MEESLLNQFCELKSKEKVKQFYNKTLDILSYALDDLKDENKNIGLNYEDTRIFPMGDYTNDTYIDQEGELEIVIATSNPQIKLTNDLYKKNYASARTKKQKKEVSSSGTLDEIMFLYANILVKYFNDKTMILLVEDGIKVLCLEEYGFKILIRFATFDATDEDAVLEFWNFLEKKSTRINLFVYNEKISKKDKETHGNYKKLVRIFKNIRKTILINKWASSSDINKYFVELIAYNIPSSIMQDKDVKLLFYKAINYLENCNVLNFKTFDDQRINSFKLAEVNFAKIKNFISILTRASF